MPVPESPGSNPGLFASLRSFWSVIVAIVYTRLDLATAELEDEAARGVKLIVAGIIALAGFILAFFFATYFIIALNWDDKQARLITIGIIFGVYLVIGLVAAATARNMILNRPRFLSQTLAELKRDAETLRAAVAAKKDEPKP